MLQPIAKAVIVGASALAFVTMAGTGRSPAALEGQGVGRRVSLVSLRDWSLVAWRRGTSVCFLWHGEPTSIETASGCRPPFASALTLLIGETGTLTRLAGLSDSTVASVSVTVSGRTFSAPTRAVPAPLGRGLRFFFLQFRPHLSVAQLATIRLTILALDPKGRRRGTLHV